MSPDEPREPHPVAPPGGPGPAPDADAEAERLAALELAALGYVPPDPDEPPPLDLWRAVGDVRPWGTLFVLLAWGALYALTGARGALLAPDGLYAWGASATGQPWTGTAWRLLASTFLHAGNAHLFFNATSLLIVGPTVERLFTRPRFWLVYAAGGAVASLASVLVREAQGGASLSVGGSGAIFALGGAVLAASARLRHVLAPTRARALAAALLYLIAPGFAAGWTRPGTDNVAHAAGVAAGLLFGALLPLDPRLGGRAAGAAARTLAALSALALAVALALGIASGLRR